MLISDDSKYVSFSLFLPVRLEVLICTQQLLTGSADGK